MHPHRHGRDGAAPAGIMRPAVECFLAAALFGAVTPVAKGLLAQVGPVTAAGLLYLGAAAAALPFALRRGTRLAHPAPVQQWRLAGAITAGGVVAPVLMLLGLRAASAASVSLWLPLETPATALLAWLWFQEHLDPKSVAAAALVLAAAALLASPDGFRLSTAALLVGGAALCWGLDNNLTALVDGYTPAQTTLAKGLIAGSFNLAVGVQLEGTPEAVKDIGELLLLGALGYGLSLMLYVRAAQQLGASRSQMFFASSPVFGIGLAVALLGEPLTWLHAAAASLVATAMVLLFTERHVHRHAHAVQRHTHSHRHDDLHHAHVHRGLPAWVRHTHAHRHAPAVHTHPHEPDLHHRHAHPSRPA